MDGRGVDGDAVTSPDEVFLAVGGRLEHRVFGHVAHHEDSTGQAQGLVHHRVCKTKTSKNVSLMFCVIVS